MRFASYTAEGTPFYGAITDEGAIALSPDFPQWPTMLDVIRAGGLPALAQVAKGRTVTHREFTYDIPIPDAPRILCVGVNFPDRNAEYKDGSAQPKYMSLFPRFASGFTGHGQNLVRPPENHTLDYEGEVAIVIGKGRTAHCRGGCLRSHRRPDASATKVRSATGCATRSSM